MKFQTIFTMPLLINLRQLEHKNAILSGELDPSDLDLDRIDELIHAPHPLHYHLEAQKLENDLLVHGNLHLKLECECVRCLKPFQRTLDFSNWAAHLPLEGEDKVSINTDCVDLTPHIREDILLAFPQHPLCENECGGLENHPFAAVKSSNRDESNLETSSTWAELNKLKL
ncbi:MAG: YceD family protein [Verrucomicrobiota bacterium]